MAVEKMTEDDIRLRYLTNNGWPLQEARDYIRQQPKALLMGEKLEILNQRLKELGQAISRAWKGDK